MTAAADGVPMSTRVSPSAAKIVWAVSSGTTTARPPPPAQGPSPARIPTIRRWTGASMVSMSIVSPTASPSSRASVAFTSASLAASPVSADPALQGEVVQGRLGGGLDPGDRHRRRQRVARAEGLGAQVGPALEGGRGHGHAGGRRRSWRASSWDRPDLPERRDAQVRPTDQRGHGAVHGRLDAGVRGEAGEQDGDPQGHAGDRQAGPHRVAPGGRARRAR